MERCYCLISCDVQSKQQKYSTIAYPDTIMELKKHNFGKRVSQFLSKMLWHLNQQPAPTYITINRNSLKSSSSKKSINQSGNNIHDPRSSPVNNRSPYQTRYRKYSIRQRTTTLASIKEE